VKIVLNWKYINRKQPKKRRQQPHLKDLKAQAHAVALGHCDPPHTFLRWTVVIWIVWRLNLSRVLTDLPSAYCYRTQKQIGKIIFRENTNIV